MLQLNKVPSFSASFSNDFKSFEEIIGVYCPQVQRPFLPTIKYPILYCVCGISLPKCCFPVSLMGIYIQLGTGENVFVLGDWVKNFFQFGFLAFGVLTFLVGYKKDFLTAFSLYFKELFEASNHPVSLPSESLTIRSLPTSPFILVIVGNHFVSLPPKSPAVQLKVGYNQMFIFNLLLFCCFSF